MCQIKFYRFVLIKILTLNLITWPDVFQLAKNVGNASFNEIMEADLLAQNVTKPDPSSDMWVIVHNVKTVVLRIRTNSPCFPGRRGRTTSQQSTQRSDSLGGSVTTLRRDCRFCTRPSGTETSCPWSKSTLRGWTWWRPVHSPTNTYDISLLSHHSGLHTFETWQNLGYRGPRQPKSKTYKGNKLICQ